MKVQKFCTLALASLAFAACSNDDSVITDGGNETLGAGEPTWASFKIDFGNSIGRTRAGGVAGNADPGITGDDAIGKGKIFLFYNEGSKSGQYETSIPFDGSNANTVTSPAVKVTAGSKKIYVITNAGADGIGMLGADTTSVTAIETALKQSVDNLTTANAFFMSNAAGAYSANGVAAIPSNVYKLESNVTKPDVEGATTPDNTKNKFAISIQRAVARVAIKYAGDGKVYDGSTEVAVVSDLQYKVSNIHSQLYPFMKTVNNVVTSPHYSMWSAAIDADAYTDETSFKTLTGNFIAEGSTGTPIYVTENTNEMPSLGQATNFYIEGTYKPKKVIVEYVDKEHNGGLTDKVETKDYSEETTGKSFWYDNQRKLYFAGTETKVNGSVVLPEELWTAYVKGKSGEAPVTGETLRAFTDGKAKYRIYIKNNSETETNKKVAIIRNYSYYVTMNKILGPGMSDGETYPGDPLEPVESETYVQATITVLPWVKVEQDEDVQ